MFDKKVNNTKPRRNNHSCHLNNFLGRLQVAQKKKLSDFSYWPASKNIIRVTEALRAEGFIFSYTVEEAQQSKLITVFLKYSSEGNPLITSIKLKSTTGFPRYTNCKYIDRFSKFHPGWVYFVSTSRGIKTLTECRISRLGGDLLFGVS